MEEGRGMKQKRGMKGTSLHVFRVVHLSVKYLYINVLLDMSHLVDDFVQPGPSADECRVGK